MNVAAYSHLIALQVSQVIYTRNAKKSNILYDHVLKLHSHENPLEWRNFCAFMMPRVSHTCAQGTAPRCCCQCVRLCTVESVIMPLNIRVECKDLNGIQVTPWS